MKILTIPRLVHDASICILEDGAITSYKMEERFSRKKHDSDYDYVLENLKDDNFASGLIIPLIHIHEKICNSQSKCQERKDGKWI